MTKRGPVARRLTHEHSFEKWENKKRIIVPHVECESVKHLK